MRDVLYKYSGVSLTAVGAILIVLSMYYPSPFLRIQTFGVSIAIMMLGLLSFCTGAALIGKLDRIGKIMGFF